MYNYKGIFYCDEKEKQYYEGGAHFKYSDLVHVLNKLIKERNKETEINSSKDSKENIIIFSNQNNIFREGRKMNNQKKLNLNFLTINTNGFLNENKLNINKSSKLFLNAEKNNENKIKDKILKLASKNMKISPLKTNPNQNKKIFSIDKGSYRTKTLENKNYKRDIYKNISIYMNNKNQIKNKNLPIIKDFHLNNFSNRNIFKTKQNNLNFDTKIEMSKYNLFLKNKMFSPLKNIKSNYQNNNILSFDISATKTNKNFIDMKNMVTSRNNKIYLNKVRLTKYIRDEIDKMKNKQNINIINLIKNKKNVI